MSLERKLRRLARRKGLHLIGLRGVSRTPAPRSELNPRNRPQNLEPSGLLQKHLVAYLVNTIGPPQKR